MVRGFLCKRIAYKFGSCTDLLISCGATAACPVFVRKIVVQIHAGKLYIFGFLLLIAGRGSRALLKIFL
jgi:hypothetical protein